jgi:hypothetical protein
MTYRVFFLGESAGVIGSHDFEASSDPFATAIAFLLSDACSDLCYGFQVWRGKQRVASLWPMNGASAGVAARMSADARKAALEREHLILLSRSRVSRSKKLLARVAERNKP